MAFFYLKSISLFLVTWIVYANIKSWLGWRRLRKWGQQVSISSPFPVLSDEMSPRELGLRISTLDVSFGS